jgi:hypothetical protein
MLAYKLQSVVKGFKSVKIKGRSLSVK